MSLWVLALATVGILLVIRGWTWWRIRQIRREKRMDGVFELPPPRGSAFYGSRGA